MTEPRPVVFLSAGMVFAAQEPTLVSTILGSCVAVCLWDPGTRIGGINHYLLPQGPPGQHALRYGNQAIARLVRDMERLGAAPARLEAKLFGGAAVLPVGIGREHRTVGDANVAVARAELANRGIAVVAHRTGGHNGLSLRMLTETGEVWVRAIVGGVGGAGGRDRQKNTSSTAASGVPPVPPSRRTANCPWTARSASIV